MKPFLLLATRADDAIADAEYEAFLRFGGLDAAGMVRVRMESAPLDQLLPDLELSDYSGVIIGGSPFTSSDPPESKPAVQLRVEDEMAAIIADVLKADIPYLGACYGIGTLGRYLGGTVDATFAEQTSAVDIRLTAEGLTDPLLDGVPAVFSAFVGHKEAIRDLPPGTVLLAGSDGCPVQMFRAGEHQYATQFHPELDLAGMTERMYAYRHSGYFDPADLDAILADIATAQVVWPKRILANFVARYAQD